MANQSAGLAPALTCPDAENVEALRINTPGDPFEQEANQVADMVVRMRFGHDFSQVPVHTGARAAAAGNPNARAFTVGPEILVGAERPPPAGPSLAAPPGILQRQPTSLGDIPENQRREIQVATIPVTVPPERVTAFFSLNASGRHGETQSIGGTTTMFGAGIDAALQTGLGSLGAWLATSTNALPMNMTIEVELDLSAHGGANRRYRFTRFEHRSGRGPSATTTPVLLIEDVGAAVAAPAQTTVPSEVTAGSNRFPILGRWSTDEYSSLHQAIHLLPAAGQTAANGLSFQRRSGNAPGSEAGHYDSSADTVELYDNAFPASSVRFGGHSPAVRNILHEIGHALDLRPLERAWSTFDAAGQSASARTALLAARSPSGTRWVRDAAGGDYNQAIQIADRSPAFRVAVRADGVAQETGGRTTPEGTAATLRGGVTTYSDTDYQELYAESFMLYVTSPDTLRLLRPRTFDYFARNFPRGGP